MLEVLRLFNEMGCSNKQLVELLGQHPDILFKSSGERTLSLIGFLLKFGFTRSQICSMFLQFPQIQIMPFVLNLRKCVLVLNKIEMEVTEIQKIVCSHPMLLVDSISPSQSIRDDGSTLVSTDGSFELGFFSPAKYAESVMVQLLYSGNLVVRDVIGGRSLWQSFDYLSDTLLPEMKLGWDFRTDLKREISAWKNSEDPCPGEFTYGIEMEPHAYPEAYFRKDGVK
ncbi:hypothetical protein ACLB2K_029036 [Fragaria x ananassa]